MAEYDAVAAESCGRQEIIRKRTYDYGDDCESDRM